MISLNLSKNRLIDCTFSSTSLLPNLEYLDLSFNGLSNLKTLPSKKLTTLNLSNNRLVEVEFDACDSLRTLNLSNNALEKIPSVLSSFTSLSALDLSGNLLENIHDIHDNLPCKTLSRLNLEGNRLDCVSSLAEFQNLASFTSLCSLNLGGNPLVDFASSRNIDIRPFLLFLMPNLKVLDRLDVSDRTRQYFKDETRRMNLVTSMAEMRLDSYLSSVCVLIEESEAEQIESPASPKEKQRERSEKKSTTFVEVPLKQFRKLQHHVAEMRRYLRVWIRQERQRRNVAATRIQRWVRGVLTRRRLRTDGILPFNRHRRGLVLTRNEKDELETKFPALKDLSLKQPSPEMYVILKFLLLVYVNSKKSLNDHTRNLGTHRGEDYGLRVNVVMWMMWR